MLVGTQLFLAGFLAEMISRVSRDKLSYQIRDRLNVNE
jgi:hypothetical protein